VRTARCVDTLAAMRTREVAAVVAGMVGAATTHVLDTAGLLPGVHESADVRTAMSPAITVTWLMLAGGLAWLATRTKPALVGGISALVVSGIPELLGRHDPGALGEPGAVAGALVQWLLLLAVIAVAVVVDRSLSARRAPSPFDFVAWISPSFGTDRHVSRLVDRRGRPRAPPRVLPLPATVS
jgi:hypothetical protein